VKNAHHFVAIVNALQAHCPDKLASDSEVSNMEAILENVCEYLESRYAVPYPGWKVIGEVVSLTGIYQLNFPDGTHQDVLVRMQDATTGTVSLPTLKDYNHVLGVVTAWATLLSDYKTNLKNRVATECEGQ
jgi:hypothetical protein